MRKTNRSMLLIFALLIAVVLSLSAVSAEDVAADGDIISVDDSISDVSLDDASIGETANEIGSVEASSEETLDAASVSTNANDDDNALGDGEGSSWYVDSNVETSGDGSQASPFKTIGEAVNAGAGTGTIYLASGIYNGTDDRNFTFDGGELSIIGSGRENTIVDMLSDGRFAFVNANSTLFLSNLKFTNADVRNDFGAVLYDEGILNIENCDFENGYCANWGGALFIKGNTTIRNCNFINNSASQGGAICIYCSNGASNHLIENCTFDNNNIYTSSGNGGTIYIEGNYNDKQNLTIKDSTFTGTYKTVRLNKYIDTLIDNCTFFNNTCPSSYQLQYGEGVVIYSTGNCNITVNSCDFENNTKDEGYIIYALADELRVSNSKFLNNIPNMVNYTIWSGSTFYLENNTCDSIITKLTSSFKSGLTVTVLDNATHNINSFVVPLYATLTDDNGNVITGGSQVSLLLNDRTIKSDLNFNGGQSSYYLKEALNGTYLVQFLLPSTYTNVTYKTGVVNVVPNLDTVDIYVATTGSDETGDGSQANPYKTVEKGLDVANTVYSANIHIKGGTYDYSSFKNIDTAGGVLNIMGYDGDVVIDMGNKYAFCDVSNRSNVLISNITFMNGNYSNNWSLMSIILSYGNLTVKNCNFMNNTGYYATLMGANLVDSCTFYNNTQPGGSSYGSDINTCRNIINSTFYGTQLSSYPSVAIGYNINNITSVYIEGCKFYTNSFIRQTSNRASLTFESCEFNNPEVSSIIVQYKNLTVNNCTFSNSSQANIQLSGSSTIASITNSKFINNTGITGQSSVYDSNIKELYLENNIALDNAAPYVYAALSSNNRLITSPTTIVILNNETVEVEGRPILKAKIFDDNGNLIALSQFSFNFANGTFSGKLTNGEFIAQPTGIFDGTYLVSATSTYLKNLTVKTGVLVVTPIYNRDLYVSTSGSDETGDGTESNPYASIQKAMEKATAINNYIHIAEGVYNVEAAFAIDTNYGNLSIVGSGKDTILDMGNSTSFISSISSNSIVELKNLTLSNAINRFITSAGTLTLDNINLINATGSTGGAIRNTGQLTVMNSYFENIVASSNGGAIWNNRNLYLLNNIFNKTTSANSGGAVFSSRYLYLENNTFIDTSGLTGNNIFASNTIEGRFILTVMDNETWDISSNPVTFNASLTDENNNPIYVSGMQLSFYLDGINVVSASMTGEVGTASADLKVNGVHVLSATLGNIQDMDVKTAVLNISNPNVFHDVYISAEGSDETGDGTSANPYATFTKAFSVVEMLNGVIHVMSNYTLTSSTTISDVFNLTIIGEGDDVCFKGATGQIFYINNKTSVNFANIKFTEGTNSKPLISAAGQSKLTLINCTYENNNVENVKEGLFLNSSGDELNLIGCKINNNLLNMYSIYLPANFIYCSANLTVINTTFRANSFSNYGGAANIGRTILSITNNTKSALFENCIIEDNIGGFLSSRMSTVIKNCTFTNNSFVNPDMGLIHFWPGTSYQINEATVQDSVFVNNNVSSIIFSTAGTKLVKVFNNTFDSINCGAVINVTSSSFINNNTFKDLTGQYIVTASGNNAYPSVITIYGNDLSNAGQIKYINIVNNLVKINGSTYTLTFNDNATWDVIGNTIVLNATLVDAEGNSITGNGAMINFTFNDELVASKPCLDVTSYSAKFGGEGQFLVSGYTNVIYDADSLTIKTAVLNITQLENKVIYVDILGNDETGDGSEENPYASLSRAMEDVIALNNIIYIQPGVYDNMVAGNQIALMENQTLSLIGLSNEVDKVVIKNISKTFIDAISSNTSAYYGNLVIKDIDFVNANLTSYFISVSNLNCSEFTNVNILDSYTGNYLVHNLYSHIIFSNVNVSNVSLGALIGGSSNNITYFEAYDSVFENCKSTYNNYIEGKVNIVNSAFNNISVNPRLVLASFGFNSTNSTFTNINAQYLIYLDTSQGIANIRDSVFSNNVISNTLIFNSNNFNVNVSNSVFASNQCNKLISCPNLVANGNWWGNNTNADELRTLTGIDITNWIVVDVTANDSDIGIGDEVTFNIILKLNDGSELADILPTRIVKAIAANTEFDAGEVEIEDNMATITGTVLGTGDIFISIDNQEFVFKVNGYSAYLTVDNVAIVAGEDAKVTVTLTDDEGPLAERVIALLVDENMYSSTTDDNGIATFTIPDLAKGNHIAQAFFLGDELYDEASGAGMIMVSDAILTVDVPSVLYGSPVTINVGLVDSEQNPLSGLVIVNINGEDYNVLVDQGVGTLTVPIELDAGDYTVNANLIGEDNAIASTAFTVNKLLSELTVTVADVAYGQPITVNLEIADKTISGLSIVNINGIDYAIDIVDGVASKTIALLLEGGSYDVTAKFIGDNYDIPDAAATFTVTPSSNTQLDAEIDDHSLVITLTDESGNGISGAVNVTIDGVTTEVPIVNGRASVDIPDGEHSVAVEFTGDANNGPASISKDVNVESKTLPTEVKVTVSNVTYGEAAAIEFNVTDKNGNPISGVLNVSINDIIKEVTVTGGSASISLDDLASGNYAVIANYIANGNYEESTGAGIFNVAKIETSIDYKDMTTVAIERSIEGNVGKYFTITLKDSNGKALANKAIQIGFNGKIYKRTTDQNGKASLQVNLPTAGFYTFAVTFLGDENCTGTFVAAKITVNKQKGSLTVPAKSYKESAKTKSLTATFKTASGKLLKDKKITFTVNGKTYTAKTDAKGVATVNVSLSKKGTYKFTAKFAGDITYAALSKTATLTIK